MEQCFGSKEIHDLYINTLNKYERLYNIKKNYYEVLNIWLKNKNNNKSVSTYFVKNNIKTIAIYGGGNLGELLYSEIKNDKNLRISYIIDQNIFNNNFNDISVVNPEKINNMKTVDAIIVTPIYAYEQINTYLKEKGFNNNICIDDIIYQLNADDY